MNDLCITFEGGALASTILVKQASNDEVHWINHCKDGSYNFILYFKQIQVMRWIEKYTLQLIGHSFLLK